jgi:hypothetical protein
MRPERMAWGVLLIAFAIFCVVCAILSIGIYLFLFESNVTMQSLLTVGRGTVIITEADLIEQAVRFRRELLNGTTISTDSQSQAAILFLDTDYQSLVASITLYSDSDVTLIDSQRPRFDWSYGQYSINLMNFSGNADIFVPDTLSGDFRITLRTPDGTRIYLIGGGHYVLSASPSQVEVMNRDGIATLIPADSTQEARSIPAGQQGVIDFTAAEIALLPGYVELLSNSSFEQTREGQSLPLAWECSDLSEPPISTFSVQSVDERPILRLLRDNNASNHGETRCTQGFNPASTGLDVRAYNELTLRATFYVNYQSLSECGIVGTECALMLRMDYTDIHGNPRRWVQGFYAYVDPSWDSWPNRCDTCAQAHVPINPQVWYTYVTDNLFTMFPPDQRPAAILNVQFYASGHQYDVFVSEMALLAAIEDAP